MVDMRSTQLLKTSDIFECNTQLVVSILIEPQLFVLFQTKVLFIKDNFHFDKEYISQSTRKVKTQNDNVFILEQEIHLFYKFTFPGKTLISTLTSKLITVDSKRTEQTIHSVISNVRIRTNQHQMQMLILNRLRLKTRLFSNTVSL